MDQAKYDKETAEIARLEAIDINGMTPEQLCIHRVAISDAHWRRRMAMRTEDEVKRGVCAP